MSEQDQTTHEIAHAENADSVALDTPESGLDRMGDQPEAAVSVATINDDRSAVDENGEVLAAPSGDWNPDTQLHNEQSTGFIGKWKTLVSQTNWDKGRVIQQWRDALKEKEAPAVEYSDEAWSRLVGGITSQHVGRLRRVYSKFSEVVAHYDGLFWSHFYAAMDWDDAEMWLEGATKSKWSVSQMRNQRWETMGKLADQKPNPKEEIHSEIDEDLETTDGLDKDKNFQSEPKSEGPDFGDESDGGKEKPESDSANLDDAGGGTATMTNEDTVPNLRPFESVGDLPEAFADLVEEMKLSIIRYKTDEWNEVSQDQMVAVLDGLKHLVVSKSDIGEEKKKDS